MKWAHLVQWECLGRKGRPATPGAQESLLQASLEKKAPQALQGDLGHLDLQVPLEELQRLTLLTRVHLEIQDPLALMVPEVQKNPGKGWQ